MSPLLSLEAAAQLDAVRRVASALSTATATPDAAFNHAAASLTISSPAKSVEVLREAGAALEAAAAALTSAIETQLVEFFEHLRQKERRSITALLSPHVLRSQESSEDNAYHSDRSDGKESCSEKSGIVHSIPRQRNLPSLVPRGAGIARHSHKYNTAVTALQTSLRVMMESMLTRTDASCAAVFVNSGTHSSDGARVLYRIAHLNCEGRSPKEIRYASSSSLITVVRTGVAVHFVATESASVPSMSNEKKKKSHNAAKAGGAKGNVSKWGIDASTCYALHFRRALLVPLSDYGCVLLAEKSTDFTTHDEHIAWAFASLCEGIFRRYPRDMLVGQARPVNALAALHQRALLPPIAPPLASTAKSAVLGLLECTTAVPKRLAIVRAKIGQGAANADTGDSCQEEVSSEQLFQHSANHIAALEYAWHKSMKEIIELREYISKSRSEVEQNFARIAALEAELLRANKRNNPSTSKLKGAKSHRIK